MHDKNNQAQTVFEGRFVIEKLISIEYYLSSPTEHKTLTSKVFICVQIEFYDIKARHLLIFLLMLYFMVAFISRAFLTFEPPRGKTNNVVSEQVRHKPGCTSTEKS